jgi:diaminopimelate epimerase
LETLNPVSVVLNFYKYHGTGNDFILINNRDGHFTPQSALIERLCDRHFGIGADGLITLNKTPGFDFGMRYFNSDGHESTMCGNGGRCIVAFADYLSLAPSKSRFLAADGEHFGTVLGREGNSSLVRLSMNDVDGYRMHGEDFVLNTGSPHLVRFSPDVENTDVVKIGREIRYGADFQPGGINVNFVEERKGAILVRTYERGVEDETLSCGTGITASSLAYAALKGSETGIIPVSTRGGQLSVSFSRKGNGFSEIYLEGPAARVYEGTINILFST